MLHINNYHPIVLQAWNTTEKNRSLKVYICNIHFNRYYSGSDHSSRLKTDVNAHMNIYVTDVTRWQIFRGSQWKRVRLLQKCKEETWKQPVQKPNMTYCHIATNIKRIQLHPWKNVFIWKKNKIKNLLTSHQYVKDQAHAINQILCVSTHF